VEVGGTASVVESAEGHCKCRVRARIVRASASSARDTRYAFDQPTILLETASMTRHGSRTSTCLSPARHVIAAVFAAALLAGPAQAQALRPLPPEFLATLAEIDTSVAAVGTIYRRFKNEELGIKSPSAGQLDEAIARVEKGVAGVRTQTEELRRRESLVLLLSMKGSLGAFTSDLAGLVNLLQSATVRNPAALERLNRELAELERGARAADAALRKFDGAAQALLERLDRQAAERPR
jgi:uncharacterized membrane protein YdfJ with MMPL/SSD domain